MRRLIRAGRVWDGIEIQETPAVSGAEDLSEASRASNSFTASVCSPTSGDATSEPNGRVRCCTGSHSNLTLPRTGWTASR